jgi:ornithine cyclodeaminase/alanine dehydrogenase-like protein (mu-crystallin family)
MKAIRLVSAEELRAHVRFEDLIDPMATAFRGASAGSADSGLVIMYPVEPKDRGDVYVKTGTLQGHSVYVVKVSPWFAANVQSGVAQGGFLAVFDSHSGHTLAILNEEHYLSDIRTAAAGAIAARTLAPQEVRSVSVLGSGDQAYWQSLALYGERPFETLMIWARNSERAEALRTRLSHDLPNVHVRVEWNLEQAVRQADVLVCATSAREPLVHGEWLRHGQHITAVGADDPRKCELDVSALRRARVFVDSLETAVANGDIYRAIKGGGYTRQEVTGEIGDVLSGAKIGRLSSADITIAKLVGIGAQDLVAAEVALAMLP